MRAVVFFATCEGQTRQIAERVAGDLRAHGVDIDVRSLRSFRRGRR